jgi:hypothetical protein
MRISADAQSLTVEQRDILSRRTKVYEACKRAVKAASLALERRIKSEMPVDTGRARASWGHWTPGDVHDNPEASAGDANWEEKEQGLAITQGSNVEYVEYLNDGHSAQAPMGFLDVAEAQAERELDDLIDAIMRDF